MASILKHRSSNCKTSRLLALSIYCVLNVSLWAREVDATPSSEKNLELVVTTDRVRYDLDDEIQIEVKLINKADNPLYILGILSWGFGGNLALTILDDKENPVVREFPEHGGIIPSMAGDNSLVLRLESQHFYGTSRVNDIQYLVQKPGRYRVRAEYHLPLAAKDFDVEPFWGEEEGPIESYTFIEVLTP